MMAPSSSRNGAKVIWVVVHTAEGARDVDDLQAYFNSGVAASSHAGADDEKLEEGWVPYDRASWTLRNGNSRSDNLELCGFAKWTRAEWLNNHRGMLNHAATWIRRRCLARGIPMMKLSAADVRAGKAGVIGHVDYTNGTGDGTHWDPGPGFPWDVVMARARGEENDMDAGDTFWASAWANKEGTFGSYLHQEAVRSMGTRADVEKIYGNLAAAPNAVIKAAAEAAEASADRAQIAASSANTGVGQLTSKVDALSAKVDKIQLGGVDHDLLADKLAERLAKRLES